MACFAQSWSESNPPATVLMQFVQRMTIKNQSECKAGVKRGHRTTSPLENSSKQTGAQTHLNLQYRRYHDR